MRSSLQEQEREYQSFATSVEQAFNSQLRGLLSGTETWRTAFRNVLEDLLIKFIEWTETTVAHYVDRRGDEDRRDHGRRRGARPARNRPAPRRRWARRARR